MCNNFEILVWETMYLSVINRILVLGAKHSSVSNVKLFSKTYTKNIVDFKTKINNFAMPERFKGTFVEKWSLYWRDLYSDYYEVARETIANAKSKPRKTFVYLTCFGVLICCSKMNPSETSYRDRLLSASNDLLLVSKSVRNPVSDEHLIFIESCYNAGLIRNFSFWIFSVMWIDDYDKAVGLYKANCPYLQPDYLTIHQRVVDIGFLNKWWFIDRKMKDYDINPMEWPVNEP